MSKGWGRQRGRERGEVKRMASVVRLRRKGGEETGWGLVPSDVL